MRAYSSLLLIALVACNGAGGSDRPAVESTDFAVVGEAGGDVLPPPAGSQSGASAAFDGTAYLVVWSDARNGTTQDLFGARVGKSGEVLDPAPIVISAAPGDQTAASVAFDGTNYLVVWQDQRSGTSGRDVFAARVTPDGRVLDPNGIPVTTAPDHQVEPVVAFDGTGYLVAWEDRRTGGAVDVRGARVNPDGTVLGEELALGVAPGAQTQPAVACAAGTCLVAWRDARASGPDIYGTRVAGTTVVDPAGLPLSRAGSSQGKPAIASDGTGFLVAWNDTRGGTGDVYATRVTAAGEVLDAAGIAVSRAADLQQTPALAFEGSYYVVGWHDHRSGVRNDVYAARVTPAGAVKDADGFLVGSDTGARATSVATDGAGRVLFAYDGTKVVDALTTVSRVRVQGFTIRAELSVSLTGNGSGSVSSEPAGVDCGERCAATFDAPTVVTLTPAAAPGSAFVGWSGACAEAGAGPCTVTVDEARLAIASFSPLHALTVTLAGAGTGEVTSEPAGIACGATCAAEFVEGAVVALSPTPGSSSVFAGWSGACAGKESCVVPMDAAQSVTATFVPAYAVNVSIAALYGATGTVSGGATGPVGAGSIACAPGSSAGCSTLVAKGDGVTLKAAPGADTVFKGWSGSCTGTEDCAFVATAPRYVSAKFEPATYAVKVGSSGGGVGTITGEGIACTTGSTAGCATTVANTTPYQVVTLTATPDADSLFKSWSGCTSSSGNTCTVTVSSAKTVTAVIQPSTYPLTVSAPGLSGATGTVEGPGISCTTGSTSGCTAPVANGATVTVVATPGPDSLFKSWSGCPSASGTSCTVSMTSARYVTANFMPSAYPLNVSVSAMYGASGSVSGAGIGCTPGATAGCSASVANGATVTLVAEAAPGSFLKSWSGCTSVSGTSCTVSMTSAKLVTATFALNEFALNVSAVAASAGASGTVTGPGLACTPGASTGCSTSVANGATVTLVAEPAAGSLFKSWSGCTSVSGTSCTVSMTSPKTVTATFMPSEYPLTVGVSGSYGAGGSVTGPGIGCSAGATAGCATSVANGATVTLVAEAAPGSFFKSWSGCTSVSGTSCTVSMTSAKSVTATFALTEFALNVTAFGTSGGAGGTVTGPGLACTPGASTGCSTSVANGATVTLVAEPAPGSLFKSWSGCTSISGTSCTVSMTTPKTVSATFMPSEYPLSVAISAPYGAAGSVTGPGISCTPGASSGCSAPVANGATVSLVAEPAPGSLFKSWSGCASVSGTTCTVTMTAAKTVTATFEPATYTLTVSTIGDGHGTVSAPGISCSSGATSGCSGAVDAGTTVTLTAAPNSTCDTFTGWSGSGCTGTGTCTVTMTAARTVVAAFASTQPPPGAMCLPVIF